MKVFRNLVNDQCKQAKGHYIRQKLTDTALKPLCKQDSKEEGSNIELEGCSCPDQVANSFNEFFRNVGEKLNL